VYAALYAQNWQMLAERIDALQRTGNGALVQPQIMNELLATDEGQRALAKRLSEDRNWIGHFLNMGRSGTIGSKAFGKTMHYVHTHDGELDCFRLAVVTQKLLKRGETIAADNVWGGRCEMNGNPSVTGFQLPSDTAPLGPFEWSFPSSSGLRRSFKINEGIGILDYQHSDGLRAVLAERFLRLDAGIHTIKLSSDAELQGSRLFFSIECMGAVPSMMQTGELQGIQKFLVPSKCPGQRITLSVTKGKGKGLSVIIQ
jgi:hypothetical protein